MILLPAIDIKGGQCVRLVRGDYATAHRVADDPLETADRFAAAGASWLHMVDLDGAKDGATVNFDLFAAVARRFPGKMELGGGIRSLDTVERYLSAGVARVILGSAAVKDPALVRRAVRAFGARVAVGIDARDGLVAAEGWLDATDVHYLALAAEMERIGVRTLIFTDISKDGTLSGPNLAQLEALSRRVGCDVIASGGVHVLEDIRALRRLGLYGAICGKSLYEGTLELHAAIAAAE